MAYVTESYYTSTYFGTAVGSEFAKLAKRASDHMDMKTGYGIVLADLDADQLLKLQDATCAQIEYYFLNGFEFNESSGGSESIGAYSYNKGNSAKLAMGLCPRAIAYLEQSGLMFRGVAQVRS